MARFTRAVSAWEGGERVGAWPSAEDAARWLREERGWPRANRERVYGAASGLRRSAYGYEWRFEGEGKRPHGAANGDDPRLYKTWARIRARVAEGGRACEAWEMYDEFREWAESHGYEAGMSVARRDYELPDGPDNTYFAWPSEGCGYVSQPRRKPVARRSPDGRVATYPSIYEASAALVAAGEGNASGDINATSRNICKCLKGKTMSAYGYRWSYLDPRDR